MEGLSKIRRLQNDGVKRPEAIEDEESKDESSSDTDSEGDFFMNENPISQKEQVAMDFKSPYTLRLTDVDAIKILECHLQGATPFAIVRIRLKDGSEILSAVMPLTQTLKLRLEKESQATWIEKAWLKNSETVTIYLRDESDDEDVTRIVSYEESTISKTIKEFVKSASKEDAVTNHKLFYLYLIIVIAITALFGVFFLIV